MSKQIKCLCWKGCHNAAINITNEGTAEECQNKCKQRILVILLPLIIKVVFIIIKVVLTAQQFCPTTQYINQSVDFISWSLSGL